jgi:hypothetical protein
MVPFEPGRFGILVLISIIVVAIFVDTTLIRIYAFTGGLRAYTQNIAIFSILVIVYSLSQYFILRFASLKKLEYTQKGITIPQKLLLVVQYLVIFSLILIIVQLIVALNYSTTILKFVICINYGVSVFLLGVLAQRFFAWYKVHRSYITLAYAIAISTLSLNALIAVFYVMVELTDQRGLEYVKPSTNVVSIVSEQNKLLNSTYLVSSVVSFTMMWFATVMLTRQYIPSLKAVRYWVVVSLILIYFLSQFEYLFMEVFTTFRGEDPILFGIVYTLFFSITKPIGGVLFGVAFWSASRRLENKQIKDYMLISAYGVILLFSSNQPIGLTLAPFPPFGLATVSFLGIGSYLILVGVYSSALSVANDVELRKSVKKSVEYQRNLLGTIGSAEVERQLFQKVIGVTKAISNEIKEETGVESSLDEEGEVKEYLQTVLDEINRNKKENHNDR